MTLTKILIGHAVIVIAGLWLATAYTVAAFGYESAFGKSWKSLFGTPVSLTWRLFEWWYIYEAYGPRVFMHGAPSCCHARERRGSSRQGLVLRGYRIERGREEAAEMLV